LFVINRYILPFPLAYVDPFLSRTRFPSYPPKRISPKTSSILLSFPAIHFPLFPPYPQMKSTKASHIQQELLSLMKSLIFSINVTFKTSD